ncbi:peptidase, partial [Rhodoplanes roseus]
MDELIELPRVTRSGIEDGGLMLRAGSYDEAANTIEVIWTTGATVRRYDWRRDGYIDEQLVVEPGAIRLDRLNGGAPFLNTHDAWTLDSVIGAVERGSVKIGKGQGTATVRLSRAPSHADIVQNIRDGIIQNV